MNTNTPLPIQDALHTLLRFGFQECTEAVSRQHGTTYLYAFVRIGDDGGIPYCCETPEDLLALVSLVEATVSQ